MALAEGDKAPDFTLPAEGGKEISLSDYKGKQHVVLYFYPKDDTPGCTKEACGFRDLYAEFEKADTVILGVSKDSVKKHDNFIAKYDLPFSLVSDEEISMIPDYDAWVEKSMYGRKYMGIDRATFLIDKDGVVRRVWHKVKVTGHMEEVLEAAKAL